MFRSSNPFFPSYGPYYPQHQYVDPERARALAAQHARRAQWLPDDEIDDFDNDHGYNQLGPQGRAWVNAHQNQAAGLRRRAEEEQGWQQQLARQQKEDQQTRERLEEERERQKRAHQDQIDGETKAKHERDRSQSPSHSRGPQPPANPSDHSIPSPQPQSQQKPRSTHDQQASPNPPPHRSTSSPPVPQYDQKHVDAASKLQHHFRIHQSFRAINSLSSQFHTLRGEFTYPPILSFQSSSSPPNSSDVVNVPAVLLPAELDSTDMNSNSSVPKLAFNSTNYVLHSYLDSLDKLLIKLDGIESWGDQDVRARRRAVIKQIEEEQARLDKMSKDSWIKYIRTEAKA